MSLGHEKPDGYRQSIEYVAWELVQVGKLNGFEQANRYHWTLRKADNVVLEVVVDGEVIDFEADDSVLERGICCRLKPTR